MLAITATAYGTPDVLTLDTVAEPTVGARDVLVQVIASGITRGDTRLRAADYPGPLVIAGRLFSGVLRPRHRVPGTTFAGRVVAIGRHVTEFAPGDDVFGLAMHGAHAERLVISADKGIAHMPRGVAHADIATLAYGATSACYFVDELGDTSPGEHVVVIGAGGGVGRYAVQIALARGARVTAICSPRHHALMRQLGVHAIVEPNAPIAGPIDVVLDTSGTSSLGAWSDRLVDNGRFVTTDLSARLALDLFLGMFRSGPKARTGVAEDTGTRLGVVRDLIDAGHLTPLRAATFDLRDIANAHTFAERERPSGDVVVRVSSLTPAMVAA